MKRADLNDAAQPITTLFEIGVRMKEMERDGWSHWKNKEDYRFVYGLPHDQRYPMELVYSHGRSFCADIGSLTNQFVYGYADYPTVSAIVRRLAEYISKLDLDKTLSDALVAKDRANFQNNYAFDSMCYQLESQIQIVENIKLILNSLRETDQYKRENGMSLSKHNGGITVHGSNNVNISAGSPNSQQSISVNGELGALIAQMIDVVNTSSLADKNALIAAIEELKDDGTPPTSRYATFIDKVKNHMAIFGPFVAPLGKLLFGP